MLCKSTFQAGNYHLKTELEIVPCCWFVNTGEVFMFKILEQYFIISYQCRHLLCDSGQTWMEIVT